jgi:hypothetical protein
LSGIVKRAIQAAFKRAGFTIRRVTGPPKPLDPSRIFDDPMEALHYHRGGKRAAFHCPLELTVQEFGFSFAPRGWHPFVAALKEYGAGLGRSYDDSYLKRFYDKWQPAHAGEVIIGFPAAPEALRHRPCRDAYMTPWTSLTIQEMRDHAASWYNHDHAPFGARFDPDTHGDKYFGPAHPDLGQVSFVRLTRAYESIRSRGYDRRLGDVNMALLRRGPELKFLKWGGGTHRTAAMAALGHTTIPATFSQHRAAVLDVADVDYWPNVRSGLWSREAAMRYVDHLFDFDTARWAAQRGLLLEQQYPDWQDRRDPAAAAKAELGDASALSHEPM